MAPNARGTPSADMIRSSRRQSGFTLIELMVTLAVLFIFIGMAVPSFNGMRQRAAIRGAADQTLSFWNEARFEAVKRNKLVKFGIGTGPNGAFCLGAATTNDETDALPCDCMSAAPTTNVCDVARWPSDQSEWNGARFASASIAGSVATTVLHPVVIEPKRTTLTSATARGTISLATPVGQPAYRLNLSIDHLGKGLLCESLSSTDHLPEYNDRRCAD